ncbi:MAG TPA: helix-turn-helix domain-containing protein [Ornithinicoccus sp.]|nr:helix-turn-helix domain-containing protein [Ornithinicoccus sp.]
MDQPVDRRVRRTRDLLRRALLELIREKGFDRVTVQDIVERADVGRSTFYAHFRDKEDLLVHGLEELREAFDPAQEHPPGSLAVFEHLASCRDVWQAMASRRGGELFLRHLHGFLSDLVREQLRTRAPDGPTQVPLDALVEFAVSTMIGLGMRWWQLGERELSAREVDRIYRRLTAPAIEAGLQPAFA